MNIENGSIEMMRAARNQVIHSGISALVVMKISDTIAAKVKSLPGETLPIAIPASMSTAACYLIHRCGIPEIFQASSEPALSTIPTAILVTIMMTGYHIVHHGKRIRERFEKIMK